MRKIQIDPAKSKLNRKKSPNSQSPNRIVIWETKPATNERKLCSKFTWESNREWTTKSTSTAHNPQFRIPTNSFYLDTPYENFHSVNESRNGDNSNWSISQHEPPFRASFESVGKDEKPSIYDIYLKSLPLNVEMKKGGINHQSHISYTGQYSLATPNPHQFNFKDQAAWRKYQNHWRVFSAG